MLLNPLRQIDKVKNALIDLYDPSGVYFHCAWKACLAGLLAAAILYVAPQIGQSILVIAAIIFAHKTSGKTPRQQQQTMLLAALIVILGIGLLGGLGNYLLLQAALLIGLADRADFGTIAEFAPRRLGGNFCLYRQPR